LLTIVVVGSGFVGRYIYTAIPRTAEGAELESVEIERVIQQLEREIRAVQAAQNNDPAASRANAKLLNRLTKRRRVLRTQMSSLASARRLMSLWHTIHIPIGMLVFTAAFFHILAAVYYATLIR
jgi:hypothetical protein